MKPFVPEKWIPLFLIVLAEKEPSKATVLQVFLKLRLEAFQDFQYHVSAYSSYL